MAILNVFKPPVAYMPFETALLAISMGNASFVNWINCHFVQLGINMVQDSITGVVTPTLYFVDTLDEMDIYSIPSKMLGKFDRQKSFSDYINHFVERGFYIFLYVDEYYLPNYDNYQINHDMHPILIYGIKDNEVYIADFFRQGMYTFEKCTVKEVDAAVHFLNSNRFGREDKESDVILLKPVVDEYVFDKSMLKTGIVSYLHSRSIEGKKQTQKYQFYGLTNYHMLLDYFQKMKFVTDRIDYRMLSFHTTHKKLMLDKLLALQEIDIKSAKKYAELANSFKNVLRLCQLNLSLALKYNTKTNNELITRICNNIDIIRDEEKRILEDVVSLL